MLIRHTVKTRRERLVLAVIRWLLPDTPLVVNVLIGPDYAGVQSRDGRSILADRIDFDTRAYIREAACHGRGPSPECASFPPLPEPRLPRSRSPEAF